jgi:predicted transport protein
MHTDSIINELNEAVDISSSKKTIAYKYFKGNLVDLEKYLDQNLNSNPNISLLIPSRQLELFS